MKPIKQYAKRNRKRPTFAEAAFRKLVQERSLGNIRSQTIIGNMIIDFAFPYRNLLVEIDGSLHSSEDVKQKDIRRDLFLTRKGFNVVRFTNDQVLKENDKVSEIVQKFPSSLYAYQVFMALKKKIRKQTNAYNKEHSLQVCDFSR